MVDSQVSRRINKCFEVLLGFRIKSGKTKVTLIVKLGCMSVRPLRYSPVASKLFKLKAGNSVFTIIRVWLSLEKIFFTSTDHVYRKTDQWLLGPGDHKTWILVENLTSNYKVYRRLPVSIQKIKVKLILLESSKNSFSEMPSILILPLFYRSESKNSKFLESWYFTWTCYISFGAKTWVLTVGIVSHWAN